MTDLEEARRQIDALSRAALTALHPCTCGHARGDHASTAGTSFNLRPVQWGRCRIADCPCRRFTPLSKVAEQSEDQHDEQDDDEDRDDRHDPVLPEASVPGPDINSDMPTAGPESRSDQSEPAVPALIGLCPGEHTHEFYVPLKPGEGTICPECDRPMVLYARVASDDQEGR
jgi:hypothetical protein